MDKETLRVPVPQRNSEGYLIGKPLVDVPNPLRKPVSLAEELRMEREAINQYILNRVIQLQARRVMNGR